LERKLSVAPTLLIQCDSTGRVLWMSPTARDLLGDQTHLTDLAVPMRRGRRVRLCASQFCRVWTSRDSVLLSIRLPEAPGPAAADFERLERRLFQKVFRLVAQERRLFDSARKHIKPGGRTAIRQIELERQRLARELHTGVGQVLAAIRLQVELISAELRDPPAQVSQALASITVLADGALQQVRSVSQRLHPPEWQRLTLASALRQLWELSGIPERFEGALVIDPLPSEPAPEVKALLYRAMQEALSNVLRHSKATRVQAELRATGGRVVLTIADNGIGFDFGKLRTAPASVSAGIGLRSIRELVEGLAGDFDMQSGPLGTKLIVSVVMAPAGY
jgi:signal transduction histidine kinase